MCSYNKVNNTPACRRAQMARALELSISSHRGESRAKVLPW